MLAILMQALLAGLSGSLISEIALILGIILVLVIVFKFGKFVLGLITNSILGLIGIFVLNALFGIGIPLTLPIIVVTALFGMPALAILVLLRLFGIALS